MPYSAIPVMCVKCGLELKPEISGIVVRELFQKNSQVYKIWQADLVKCPGCGILVIKGFAQRPLAGHYSEKEKFQNALNFAREKLSKNECFDLKENY